MLTSMMLALLLGTTTPAMAEPKQPPLTVETKIMLYAYIYGVDPKEPVRIARCESGLKQFENGNVIKGKVNAKDIGIFQINEKYHLKESIKKGLDIYSENGNIEYGIQLYKEQGNKPWNWSKNCWKN